MSPRLVVFAIVAALVVGLAAGRAFVTSPDPAATNTPRAATQDDAAASASRAMTFTQPKAPGK